MLNDDSSLSLQLQESQIACFRQSCPFEQTGAMQLYQAPGPTVPQPWSLHGLCSKLIPVIGGAAIVLGCALCWQLTCSFKSQQVSDLPAVDQQAPTVKGKEQALKTGCQDNAACGKCRYWQTTYLSGAPPTTAQPLRTSWLSLPWTLIQGGLGVLLGPAAPMTSAAPRRWQKLNRHLLIGMTFHFLHGMID